MVAHLKNPVIREQGVSNGKGLRKRYATKSSTTSSIKQAENRCEAAHRFASLHIQMNSLYKLQITNEITENTSFQIFTSQPVHILGIGFVIH